MSIVKMKKGDKVDFERCLYILKRGEFIFVLCEPSSGKFIFVCFTQNDYSLGLRFRRGPALMRIYESVEEAISSLVDNYEIYQFDNWGEYFKWLITGLEAEI